MQFTNSTVDVLCSISFWLQSDLSSVHIIKMKFFVTTHSKPYIIHPLQTLYNVQALQWNTWCNTWIKNIRFVKSPKAVNANPNFVSCVHVYQDKIYLWMANSLSCALFLNNVQYMVNTSYIVNHVYSNTNLLHLVTCHK